MTMLWSIFTATLKSIQLKNKTFQMQDDYIAVNSLH